MFPEGSAYPLRNLWDVAVRQRTVKFTCRACGHVRILHGHALWWLFEQRGWPNSLVELRRRAVCQPCRDRGRTVRGPTIELVHEEITGAPLPLPRQSEWKRALARHR